MAEGIREMKSSAENRKRSRLRDKEETKKLKYRWSEYNIQEKYNSFYMKLFTLNGILNKMVFLFLKNSNE